MKVPVLGIIIFLLLLTVITGAAWYQTTRGKTVPLSPFPTPAVEAAKTTPADLLEGGNTVNVSSQVINDTVNVNLAVLEKPGFVVIFDNNNQVIGKSDLLTSGEKKSLEIKLEDGWRDAIIAALYEDNGDGKYTQDDQPLKDDDGNPVTFKISPNESVK